MLSRSEKSDLLTVNLLYHLCIVLLGSLCIARNVFR
jgi:hypothetical protein